MGSTGTDVVAAVVAFSRALGEPSRDLVVLAEGNTSVRCDDGTMLIKVSGSRLATAAPDDFVHVDQTALLALVDSDTEAGDGDVAAALTAARCDRHEDDRRPSVESLLHAVCYEDPAVGAIAHTHATPVVSLLCSDRADALTAGSLFPDQIVVLGRHQLLVGYLDPGLPLARGALAAVRNHRATHGQTPRVIYLRNHGLFALGRDPDDALAITTMAVKHARVLQGVLAVGNPTYLDDALAARIDTRLDEQLRRARLAEA
jgi:rhamnose utilization protein RhaD (predicted bifunctional aldolase and dehydrogenase)